VMPFPGRGSARFEPIWAADAAECVMAALDRDGPSARYELAGPQTLTHEQIVRLALRALGKRRVLVHLPGPVVSRLLRACEQLAGERAFATWDEAELLEVPMLAERGAADAEALGVRPRTMESVLGLS